MASISTFDCFTQNKTATKPTKGIFFFISYLFILMNLSFIEIILYVKNLFVFFLLELHSAKSN